MSALSFRNVWVEYGDQIVLERINLEIASGTFTEVWFAPSWTLPPIPVSPIQESSSELLS